MPRIIFQCVNTDTLRILSVRLASSPDRYYFSRGNQIPSRHPQAVQNLLHTRRGTIHTVPIDIQSVGLSPEIVALYWNAQARQFIFRGVELLADHAELDWFANAPARREAAIARRLVTRRINQQARQQAILARIQQAQNRLNQIGMANAGNQHQPMRVDPPAAPTGENPPAPPPARRPGFRRTVNNHHQTAFSSNGSDPVVSASSRAPASNYQPPPNHHVNRMMNQNNASTPIIRRPASNAQQLENLREELANVSNVTLYSLFTDRPGQVAPEVPAQVTEVVQNENQANPIIEPPVPAVPRGLQQANAGEVGSLPEVRHSVSAMDIDTNTLASTSTTQHNNTNSRKRNRRPNASSDSTL